MIPQKLQIVLISAIILYFLIIFHLLKRKALELKYTLLWFAAGVVLFILVVFPELLGIMIGIFGIQSNMNGLYIILISFIIMILMALTSIASRQTYKIKTLVQELAILEKRVRDLENQSSNNLGDK